MKQKTDEHTRRGSLGPQGARQGVEGEVVGRGAVVWGEAVKEGEVGGLAGCQTSDARRGAGVVALKYCVMIQTLIKL